MSENLTVVVTIYKVEEYLERCLESIITQEYKEFIVLMILGKGDSECKKICEKFAKRDDRFNIIESEPRGLSDARNVGILNTHTEYITFIDGDDYLSHNALNILMERIAGQKCDIVIGNYSIDDGNTIIKIKDHYRNGKYNGKEALKIFLSGHGSQFVVAWGKVYTTELFKKHNIQYPLGKLHEDNLTTYKLLYYAQAISYTSESVYCYINRSNSLSFNKDMDLERVIIDDLPNLERYVNKYSDLLDDFIAYKVGAHISYIIKLSRLKEDYYDMYLKYVKELGQVKIWNNKSIRLRMKVLCSILIMNPNFMYRVFNISSKGEKKLWNSITYIRDSFLEKKN